MHNAKLITIRDLLDLIEDVTEERYDVTNLSSGTRFVEDLSMNSLSLVALVFRCEETFNLDLSEASEEIVKLDTIGKTLDFLNTYPEMEMEVEK